MNEKVLDVAALLHAAGAAQAELESNLAPLRLSMAKLALLRVLLEAGESLPLSHLAGRLACVKSNVTQLVDRLEKDGFVVRKPDPADRRTTLAVLTKSGRDACEKGTRVQQDTDRNLSRSLTSNEARQLAVLLEKLGEPGR